MRGSSRLLLGLTSLALVLPSGASSQTVVGTVTDAENAGPLDIAFVVLLDAAGVRVATSLTDETGRYRLRARAAGTYTVRVERIGYADVASAPVALRADSTIRLDLAASPRAVPLEGIEVEGDARCTVRPGEGEVAARLWDEARKALAVTRWAQEEQVLRFRTVQWRRSLDVETLRVLHEERTPRQGFHSGSPFVSRPAGDLQRNGYIQEPDGGGFIYYAPDPAALLSDPFLDAHCFEARLDGAPEEGWVGLAFRPVRRSDLADIEGVFWLDAASAELRRLDFRYTRLPADLRSDRPGGTVEFGRIPRGPWLVRRWSIRAPHVGLREEALPGGRRTRRPVLLGLAETGGEVVAIRTQDGEPLDLGAEGARRDPVAAARNEPLEPVAVSAGVEAMTPRARPGETVVPTFELPELTATVEASTLARRSLEMAGVDPADLGRRFIDRDDIEAIAVRRDVGTILEWRGINGMRVVRPENLVPGSDELGLCVSLVHARTGIGAGRCALIVLDGRRIDRTLALGLDPEAIEAVAVLQPHEATVLYGIAGEAGAVVFWTRQGGG